MNWAVISVVASAVTVMAVLERLDKKTPISRGFGAMGYKIMRFGGGCKREKRGANCG